MATIKDVAARAGVSIKTVSRVLCHAPYVSVELHERVKQAIEELGYVPNAAARSLVTRRTNALGLIIPDIHSAALSLVAEGVEHASRRHNFDLVLCTTGGDNEEEERLARQLVARYRVDGIAILSTRLNADLFHNLYEEAVPFVLMGRDINSPHIPHVYVDDRMGMSMSAGHLIRLGHQRIGYITSPIATTVTSARLQGFEQAQREHGFNYNGLVIMDGTDHFEIGRAGMVELLRRSPRPTAVCAFNDLIALGAVQAAKQYGLRVPDDIAIMGYDNIIAARFCDPQLSTVHQPLYEMGTEAADILIHLINGETIDKMNRSLPVSLVLRQSCGSDNVSQPAHSLVKVLDVGVEK